jgi:WD40 repeat protein
VNLGRPLIGPASDSLLSRSHIAIDDRAVDKYEDTFRRWISSDKVLVFVRRPSGKFSVFKRDLTNGNQKRWAWLEVAFNSESGDPGIVKVSPNGRWLLWRNPESDATMVILDLEHERAYRRVGPRAHVYKYVWATDSKHWVLFTGVNDPGMVLSLQTAHYSKAYLTTPMDEGEFTDEEELQPGSVLNEPDGLVVRQPYGKPLDSALVAPDSTILVASGTGVLSETRPSISCLDLRMAGHAKRTYPIACPASQTVTFTCFSPDGSRVAWVADDWGSTNKSLKAGVLERVQSIYTSNIDGNAVSMLGRATSQSPDCIADLCWLPDGKTLAFDCHKCSWTVPAG